jgi:hypothetical protein
VAYPRTLYHLGEPGASVPFEYYLARRRSRWAGHVSRMLFSGLPRMIPSSWVDHERPLQRLQFNHGTGMLGDLKNEGVHLKAWDALARDGMLLHNKRIFLAMLAVVVMLG